MTTLVLPLLNAKESQILKKKRGREKKQSDDEDTPPTPTQGLQKKEVVVVEKELLLRPQPRRPARLLKRIGDQTSEDMV